MNRFKRILRQYLVRRLGAPDFADSLERLKANGLSPATIFDVGAYRGEFALMCRRVWPGAEIACFEVLEDRVAGLERVARETGGLRVFPTLLGAAGHEGVALHVCETASSVLPEHFEQGFPTREYPMRTVDEVVATDFGGRAPALMKLDVQGYELEVLKGSVAALSGMQAIVAEINLLDIHRNVPLLAEVNGWLSERGWVAYDICGLTRRPLDRALWQADFIFVPKSSALRSDKRWGG